ncbi:hypothetical protein EYF80_059213 [Liparis tanakae]|uniref:Uncharacterized protein n=1 Tax=Liparis tanakae TaxID=230148 RepID=A0A4Z2EPC8_9TELE|nr:hypothetical protein EYF80_059213 [Liparis tanakae]
MQACQMNGLPPSSPPPAPTADCSAAGDRMTEGWRTVISTRVVLSLTGSPSSYATTSSCRSHTQPGQHTTR